MLPYSDSLSVEKLGRIFDNKAECYKLFWFQAIMSKVTCVRRQDCAAKPVRLSMDSAEIEQRFRTN